MNNKKNYTGAIFAASVLIIVFIFPPLLTRNWFLGNLFHFDTTGPIGDTIGGIINPFIAIIAAWLTYKAFIMQYDANQELRKDAEINRFENIFFQLLNMQQGIINELVLRAEVINKDGKENFPTQKITLHGRETFRHIYEEGTSCKIQLKDGYVVYGGIKHNIKNLGYNYMAKNEDLSFLDHYFRHLYRIIKYVDESPVLSKKEKYSYICILRAQLSEYELGLIFYYCLSTNGNGNFKRLTETYALFNDIRDYVLNDPIEDKERYKAGAFNTKYPE